MLEEHVDLVVGDINGAAWRRQPGDCNLSIIEEAFAGSDLPMPPGPTPLWSPGAVPGDWADLCGFLKPPNSYGRWKVRQHGAVTIPHDVLASAQKIKAAIMKCGNTWCLFISMATTNREKGTSNGCFFSAPYQPSREEAMQVRTKATVHFCPNVKRPFASSQSSIRTAYSRSRVTKPSFFDLIRPRHLCLSLLWRTCFHPLHCICLFISHNTLCS